MLTRNKYEMIKTMLYVLLLGLNVYANVPVHDKANEPKQLARPQDYF